MIVRGAPGDPPGGDVFRGGEEVTMRIHAGGVALVVVGSLTALGSAATTQDRETTRLRAHFAAVERELLTGAVSHLSLARRAARERHVKRLHAYAAAGVFPRNSDFPGRAVPYFIDRHGTRCAMAYLIEQSGAAEYVQLVAERSNNAFIAEIVRDPVLGGPLLDWLDANGLSVEEAARIQPAYCFDEDSPLYDPDLCPRTVPAVPSAAYKVGTGAAVIGGLAAMAMNASLLRPDVSRHASGWLAIAAGFFGVGLGLAHLDDGGDFKTLVPINLLTGGAALVSGALTLRAAAPRGSSGAARLRVTPSVTSTGSAGIQARIVF